MNYDVLLGKLHNTAALTTLNLNNDFTRLSVTIWDKTGYGVFNPFTKPLYQHLME